MNSAVSVGNFSEAPDAAPSAVAPLPSAGTAGPGAAGLKVGPGGSALWKVTSPQMEGTRNIPKWLVMENPNLKWMMIGVPL